MNDICLMALLASTGTWLVTALGAGTVVFFKSPKERTMNFLLGFASGVMIAASFWSLLAPAIERAREYSSVPAWAVAAGGFVTGALFLWGCDKGICTIRRSITGKSEDYLKSGVNRVFMLVLSVTAHNIPEGLAVGVAFGALQKGNFTPEALMGAISLAVGIGLQNFPEGAAVSLPLRREGYSRKKSFFLGQASGIVEPAAALVGVLAVTYIEAILPFALSFAAGTMITVAVHELIPECQRECENCSYFSTAGIIAGFAVMMILDVIPG